MTIEYTYPEPPPAEYARISAPSGYHWNLQRRSDEVHFMGIKGVPFEDVPEVCEAMMTLAGHEWPVKRPSAQVEAVSAIAERIIARLEQHSRDVCVVGPPFIDVSAAKRIVREECGD